VLSLVLAVLAVMLSLPSGGTSLTGGGGSAPSGGENAPGVLSFITPKRTQALIGRERDIAIREAEIARREADMLQGAVGGVIPPPPIVAACPPCIAATTIETVFAPAQTVIKEVIKEIITEDSLTPPGWTAPRIEDIISRELKIAERERDIGKREEHVNRREHDAARRENWIMEQLYALGNEPAPAPRVVPVPVENPYLYEPQPVVVEERYKPVKVPPPTPRRSEL